MHDVCMDVGRWLAVIAGLVEGETPEAFDMPAEAR